MDNAKKLDDMMPREIVEALDKYIIGQDEAKKLVAVAIRNRVRRKKLSDEMRAEVTPKNIIMIGPTGVGKTEIARRIAKLANAPFVKVEATKYTEVGYVGRDVESMVRDLMASAVALVKEEKFKENESKVEGEVEERLLDLLIPAIDKEKKEQDVQVQDVRNSMRNMLRSGALDDKEVEMSVPAMKINGFSVMGASSDNSVELGNIFEDINSMFQNSGREKRRKVTVKRAREIIREDLLNKSVDNDKVMDEAKSRCEEMGIIFIDEIDKIANRNNTSGTDVSREGVQRDILPIVEGTKVTTKWGVIDTTNILFIAAGAFSVSKPSDLIPELQGRFPLRVELRDLKAEDFYRILTEPNNAIVKQYKALLETEGVNLIFTDEALHKVAEIAEKANSQSDNIGARRLHTVMEKLLEDLSFNAEDKKGQSVEITAEYVENTLKDIIESQDLTRYIL